MHDATVTLPHDTLRQLWCDEVVWAASWDMASLSQLINTLDAPPARLPAANDPKWGPSLLWRGPELPYCKSLNSPNRQDQGTYYGPVWGLWCGLGGSFGTAH
jgi:hypothetical protein